MRLVLSLVLSALCAKFLVPAAFAQNCGSVTYSCSGVTSFSGTFGLTQDPAPLVPGLQKTCQGAGYYIIGNPPSLGGLVSVLLGRGFNDPRNYRVCFAWGAALGAAVPQPVSGSFGASECFRLSNSGTFQIDGNGPAGYLTCIVKARVS